MGLSKYGNSIHQGAEHVEAIVCLEKNGIKRWITGFNEFAPEIQELKKDPKTKNEYEAKVLEVRRKVAYIEQSLLANVISNEIIEDIENADVFWAKVRLCKPDEDSFWGTKYITLTNEPQFLDPKNPEHMILLSVIEAGGFSSVAPSLETAQRKATPPKFYLDRGYDVQISGSELKKTKNRAKSELQTLSDKDPKKLFYIAKIIDKTSSRYIYSTPPEIIYNYLDAYTDGEGSETMKGACERFTKLAKQDNNNLQVNAVVADAILLKFLETKTDGLIYHASTSARLGRSVEEVISYLNDPQHADVREKLTVEVETGWKR